MVELPDEFGTHPSMDGLFGPEWISVKERYPKLGSRVLVWFGDEMEPYMDCWRYSGDNQYFMSRTARSRTCAHQCVTHWMPLPNPPKEGQ